MQQRCDACEVEIDLARLSEAEAIHALQQLAYASEAALYEDWSLPPLEESLTDLSAAFEKWVFLCARSGGRVVGSVRGRLEGETCHIGRLIVHPDLQGHGIGRALVAAIEKRFRQAHRFELFTGHRSERNLRIYALLGYRAFRTQRVSDRLTLVFMEKQAIHPQVPVQLPPRSTPRSRH